MDLHTRLQGRRSEIEEAILTRVYGVSDPGEAADLEYVQGLRTAVSAAIDHGLAGIESTERNPPPIPPALLVQARIAARAGISLDTVLRRYFAGYALLGDFLIEEADGILQSDALKRLLRTQASIFDRVLAAVSEEHTRELGERSDTAQERRAELVDKLLAGERLDASELAYELEAVHLGLLAKGPGAQEAIRELATSLDRRLLLVCRGETTWAWLGGRRPVDHGHMERLIPMIVPTQVSLALGEPGANQRGWCLTHRQARVALPIAERSCEPFVRYADVALLASMLQDDLLTASLREMYLTPLEAERDGGQASRETLRAYVAAGRNVSSAAAALGVNRKTVASRLRAIEATIGSPLSLRVAEVEAALRIEEIGAPGTSESPPVSG